MTTRRRLWPGQAKKPPSLAKHIVEINEAAALSDNVEQITVLASRCVRPFAGGAFTGRRSLQAHEHGSSWGVANVTNDPVTACVPPVREIMPAHRFGVLGEAAREIRGLRGHEPAPRRRRPAVAGGPEGGALLLCYSAATACGSVATGSSSIGDLDSAIAVS